MIFGMSLYEILWFFFIYSFAGWVIEVIFHAVTFGKVINRGFLTGPVCPVYGFGVVSVFAMTYFLIQWTRAGVGTIVDVNVLYLFLTGIVIATAIELIAGFLLDKLFNARWWDYSDRPFNLNGYICLEFSLIWGLAIAFVLRVVQPSIASLVAIIPKTVGWISLAVIYAAYIADTIITVLTVLKMNRELQNLAKIRDSLRLVSDSLSMAIGTGTLDTMERLGNAEEEIKEKAEAKKMELEQKKQQIIAEYTQKREDLEHKAKELQKKLKSGVLFGSLRLMRAFPSMQHKYYAYIIEELKEE